MPTTLTGLLIFVVLLLPGFAYLVGKERAGTERRTSTFRETVSIVAASVTSEVAVAAVALPILVWVAGLDLGRLIGEPVTYWRQEPALLLLASFGLLIVATAGAYCATLSVVRKPLQKLTSAYPHPSAVSAWWLLFERWCPEDQDAIVGCVLDDGSWIEGTLSSFNNAADDVQDRDLILIPPLKWRAPGGDASEYEASAACVSARRVVTMFVSYLDEPTCSEAAGDASEPSEADSGPPEADVAHESRPARGTSSRESHPPS